MCTLCPAEPVATRGEGGVPAGPSGRKLAICRPGDRIFSSAQMDARKKGSLPKRELHRMRNSYRKFVSFLMLVTFVVMSAGAYGVSAKRLAHELDHAQRSLDVLTDHHHAASFAAQTSPDSEPMSDAEHKLLHACGHAEQFVSSTFDGPEASPDRVTPPRQTVFAPLPIALEFPFRPPRSSFLR